MPRLCTCADCSFYRTRDPITGAEYIGQYIGDSAFKEHRQRDLARVRGASHLETLTVNPPLFGGPSLNAPAPIQANVDPISVVLERQLSQSPRTQAEPFHSNRPNPSSPPTSAGDLLVQRLTVIQSKLAETDIKRVINATKIVFSVPPSPASPPMTTPSMVQLVLEDTISVNRPVIEYERWLDSAEDLTGVILEGDYESSCQDYAVVLLDRVRREKEALLHLKMKEWEKVRRSTLGLPPRARRVDTVGNVSRPFRDALPQLLLTYLIVASLYLIAGISLDLCNFFLVALRKLVALSPPDVLRPRSVHLDIPRDVETAIARVSSPPKTKAFVCCPCCFALYEYDPEAFGALPEVCSSKKTKSSSMCGSMLSSRSRSSSSNKKPVRLFLYHELEDWIAYLYSRSELEDHLDQNIFERNSLHSDTVSDILESPGVRQFLGPEGDVNRPFLKRPGNEGRLVFSLNMDGFNPLMNKEAGKKISVGAMYLVCLSLPPAIRYNLENVFLVGIIPGPQEPSKDEINFVLEPLVDDLIQIWQHGFYLTSTPHHPHGRLVRGALIPLVCDLPAARQMSGFAGFQSTHFCSCCTLELSDIDNFEYKTWPRRDEAEHRRLAEEWRTADTLADQEAIFDKSGIRWSQLLRLPYWDPTKFVMIDSMHGFFLRMFQRHCRQIWGMSVDIEDGDYPSFAQDKKRPSEADMNAGYQVLRYEDDKRLQNLKRPVLQELARLTGSVPYGARAKKIAKDLIEYRTRRGWFNEDGRAIEGVHGPSADEFLNKNQENVENRSQGGTRKGKRLTVPTDEDIAEGLLTVRKGTKSDIKKLYKSVLLEVCVRLGIQIDPTAVIKKEIITLLEEWRRREGIIDISGELIEKKERTQKPGKRSKKSIGILGRETLGEIRIDMETTSLPTWVSPAPKRPGEAKSGKFTADEWRSFCLVNLPITLNRLWGHEPPDSRRRQMLDNFMHLVAAVKLATMRHMNPERIAAYEYHIHKYLTTLLTLYPGTTISPYQHLALHFPEFLRRFGPVHAWRCFPFERYNYLLQNIPTNMKLGEMESTMLMRFCKGQKLRSLINPVADYLPPVLDDLLSEWQSILDVDIRGTRAGDTFSHDAFFNLDSALEDLAVGAMTRLPPRWHELLVHYRVGQCRSTSVKPFAHVKRRVKRLGQVFQTEEASDCDSYVYFKDGGGSLGAGAIQGIFLHEDLEGRKLFFVIKPFRRLPQCFESDDPYRRFSDAAGRLYQSSAMEEILLPEGDVLYHFARIHMTLPQIPIPCILALPLDRN